MNFNNPLKSLQTPLNSDLAYSLNYNSSTSGIWEGTAVEVTVN